MARIFCNIAPVVVICGALFCAAAAVWPAAAQTANNLVCSGCVGTTDLANGAVKRPDIAGGAVDSSRLAFGAVTTSKIKARAVTSTRLAPGIILGAAGNDGDLFIRKGAGGISVRLDGDSGNVTNAFSNSQNQSNGLVKAWAKINLDGTIKACWRCNRNTSETRKINTGLYEVDFTPLGTDIRGRPRLASVDVFLGGSAVSTSIVLVDSPDLSSAQLLFTNAAGTPIDRSFDLVIY